MTTYTTIPGTDIDTDSPITESLMTKLRDNPIAITEGASGAPNIQTAAIAADAVDFSTKVPTDGSTGTWNVSASAYQTIPRGIYSVVMSAGSARVEYFANGAWNVDTVGLTTTAPKQIIGDNANVRIGGTLGTNIAAFVKIY